MLKIINESEYFTQQIVGEDGEIFQDSVLSSTAAIKTQVLSDIDAGKKVLMVTHSQGNFYGKEVYRQITEENPDYSRSLAQLGVHQ